MVCIKKATARVVKLDRMIREEEDFINTDHLVGDGQHTYLERKVEPLVKRLLEVKKIEIFVTGYDTDPEDAVILINEAIFKKVRDVLITYAIVNTGMSLIITCVLP